MIDEKLLISYLKKQKRKHNEQVVILQKELNSSLMYNHKQEYITKNLMYETMMNVIRIYEDLIEKIENGEFDKAKKNNLSTYTLPPNEMENIGQEKSIPIEGQLRGEITLLKECRSKVCQQLVEEQEKNVNCQTFLNDLYEGIDEHYTEQLEKDDELDIIRAETELKLITKILEEVEKI